MLKQLANLQKLRANKDGNIDTSQFNFLENLLVFRTLEKMTVPAESGVKFSISRQAGEAGICLLIHVDHQRFPIVEANVLRPDYLALYFYGSGCLCTIIEMKSTDNKKLEHGLEQIKSLADRLKAEFKEHLPRGFELKVQGLLLCQINAQVPGPKIEKMAKEGLTIFPAQCNDRAELYPYISKTNDLKSRFVNKPCRNPAGRGPVEQMMSCDTLSRRLPDKSAKAQLETGLHINFALSEDEYAVLATRAKKCVFFVKEHGEEHRRRLEADIAANGLQSKFDVEPLPEG